MTESRLNLATPGRVPRLLRETLADSARQPGAAVWAMAPAWVVLGFAHWLFRGFEEGRDVPVFGRYLSLYEEQFVFVLGLYVVATILAVGLIATRWQPLVLGTQPRRGLSPVLRYGAEWVWRSVLLGVPVMIVTWTPPVVAERFFDYFLFWEAEQALAELLSGMNVGRTGELTAIISLGLISSFGVPVFLYLWLRLALGLPAYVATGTPFSLRASWRRSRGFSRALWRAALMGTALWLTIKVIAWSLSAVALVGYPAPDEAVWMFAARVAIPPLNTALIQLIAAGLLARVYLATEPDPAEVF